MGGYQGRGFGVRDASAGGMGGGGGWAWFPLAIGGGWYREGR